ncbi:hypothetical protein D9611_012290 [Ephemerocybe angulata]|uniref:C3H1-type domain-containing protein n=1 Tax=Ephemerocybe angulata TaxID=980116 RepID=A0A8H5AT87_9AGAR|nr:hypothetical protein D9611_012290 [Tulosesus angulatus]
MEALQLPNSLLDRLENGRMIQQDLKGQLRKSVERKKGESLRERNRLRKRSRSASPELGINLGLTSTERLSKRRREYSNDSDIERVPRSKLSDNYTKSSSSLTDTKMNQNDNEDSMNSALRLSKKKSYIGKQRERESELQMQESPEYPRIGDHIVSTIEAPKLLTRMTSLKTQENLIPLERSDLPWADDEDKHVSFSLNPTCVETRNLLQRFTRDTDFVIRQAKISAIAPPFPDSEWTNVIKGLPVNLDTVLSGLWFKRPPQTKYGRLGDTSFEYSSAEPAKKVSNAAQWTAAWNRTKRAYRFVFKHRAEELEQYGDYIERQFSSRVPESAGKVILLDQSIREFIKGGQANLLTDREARDGLYEAIMCADGVEASSIGGFGGSRVGKGKGKGPRQQCDKFNEKRGCERKDGSCRYAHSCKKCGKGGHGDMAKLLVLWDELGIPHKEKKQVWGAPLTVIGISVDPNLMSLTLPQEGIVQYLEPFYPNARSVRNSPLVRDTIIGSKRLRGRPTPLGAAHDLDACELNDPERTRTSLPSDFPAKFDPPQATRINARDQFDPQATTPYRYGDIAPSAHCAGSFVIPCVTSARCHLLRKLVSNCETLDTSNSVVLEVAKMTPYLGSSLKALGLHVGAHIGSPISIRTPAPLTVEPTPFILFKGIKETELGMWSDALERSSGVG